MKIRIFLQITFLHIVAHGNMSTKWSMSTMWSMFFMCPAVAFAGTVAAFKAFFMSLAAFTAFLKTDGLRGLFHVCRGLRIIFDVLGRLIDVRGSL